MSAGLAMGPGAIALTLGIVRRIGLYEGQQRVEIMNATFHVHYSASLVNLSLD